MIKLRQIPVLQAFFLIGFWTLVTFTLVARAFTAGFSHDEYQFVASGQNLARHGLIPYLHYPFLHMPYLPFVNGLWFLLAGGTLLSARLLNEIFYLASACLLFVLIWRSFQSRRSWTGIVAGAAGVGLMIFDPAFLAMDGRALNHALPTFLGLLALACFLKMRSSQRAWRWIALCGLFVGLATGVRLSFAVMALPFLALLAFFPGEDSIKNRIKHSLAFGAGALAGLLPALYLFLAAPQQAFYGNWLYMRLNTLYRGYLDTSTAMSFGQKLDFFFTTILNTPVGLGLYLLFIISLGAAIWEVGRRRRLPEVEIHLSAGLALVLLPASFVPTPLWPQYFFAPVPFMLFCIFSGLKDWGRFSRLAGLAVAIAVLVTGAIPTLASTMEMLNRPQDWTTTQAARQASELKARLPSGRVLTLAPIIPLEAGLDTYPVFTVGTFSWRTAAVLSAERRPSYGIIGPDELETYLAQNPPTAILTGPEGNDQGVTVFEKWNLILYEKWDAEEPFIRYAQAHGYHAQAFPCQLFSRCTLWLK